MKKKTIEQKRAEAKRTLRFYNAALKTFDGKGSYSDGSAMGAYYKGTNYYGLCSFTNIIKNEVKSCEMYDKVNKSIRRTNDIGVFGYFKDNGLRVKFIKKQITKYKKILTVE